MKYHVAVKFLAIFLCAVCLLGAVGSAAGVVILSELDLYNKTVDEVLENRIQSSARDFARETALYYASMELGGCSEALASNRFQNWWDNPFYDAGDYGYVVRDAEGNVIGGRNEELEQGENVKRYAFPVSGQYAYLVSETPKVQDVEPDVPDHLTQTPLDGAYGVYDAIPEEGVEIYNLTLGYGGENPSGEGYGGLDSLGYLYHENRDGTQCVTFQLADSSSTNQMFQLRQLMQLTYIAFQDESGQVVYEAAAPEGGIACTYGQEGWLTILSVKGHSNTAATLTSVYQAEFYRMDDPEQMAFLVYGEEAIGEMYYDGTGSLEVNLQSVLDGNAKTTGAISEGWVSGVALYDGSGNLILDSRDTGVVTLSEDGMLYYHTAPYTVPTASTASEEPIEAPEEQPEGEPEPQAEQPEEEPEPQAEQSEGEPEPQAEQPEGEPELQAEQQDPEAPEAEDEAQDDGQEPPEEEAVPQEEQTGDTPDETQAETEATVPETTVPATVPETIPAETVAETEPVAAAAYSGEITEPTEPMLINGKPLSEYEVNHTSYMKNGDWMDVEFVYLPMPEYTVEIFVNAGALRYAAAYTLLRVVRNFRSDLFLILAGSLLLFAVCAVYLCYAAGRKPRTAEVKAGGLCRMPLDLNLGLSALICVGLVFAAVYSGEIILMASVRTGCLAIGGMAFLGSLLLVQLLYCAVAQFKTPGGYWWRNSLCGRILTGCWKLLKWMVAFLPGKVIGAAKWLIKLLRGILGLLARGVRKVVGSIGSGIRKFAGLLPLIWQWLLVGGILSILNLILMACEIQGAVVVIALNVALVLYLSYCFGVLLKSAKQMAKGDLNTKVDDKRLVGCFQEFAGELNDLADVAMVAAQKQLKSERMKTELITNVSHDIKTPLTSIINYVDLLQKPHTEEEETMYLEVLARQSQRLKKLIEDLMDMSKASTGNMNVDIATLDAVEAVNQALGEFGDKLDKAELVPVFRHSSDTVLMQADGKLTWRVMSNLLGNAVKYAMPGTRLYIDLMTLEGKVVISLKNISREELNIDADELMERFVRGDDSRNTEGSGLGLNIAKSLMELQKGQLQLLVDGDLFKVTLIFPGADK